MARPRKPTSILKLTGSAKNHPERMRERENEPENINPVGDPPEHLTDREKSCFNEIVGYAINEVLGEADRISIECAAVILNRLRNPLELDGKLIYATGQEENQFFRYMGQFGMLPADRSKISITQPKKKNPSDFSQSLVISTIPTPFYPF